MAGGRKNQKLEERMTMIEKSLEKISEKMTLMEQSFEQRMKECEKGVKIGLDIIKDAPNQDIDRNGELLTRVTVYEVANDEKLGKIERQLEEIGDKAVALGLRFQEFKTEFPTPAEARASSSLGSSEIVTTRSNKERCREILRTSQDSVLIMGDSLARGVGDKLETQCGKVFERMSTGGARI